MVINKNKKTCEGKGYVGFNFSLQVILHCKKHGVQLHSVPWDKYIVELPRWIFCVCVT